MAPQNTRKRPGTVRQITPRTESNRKAQLEQGIRITYQDSVYVVRAGDLSALDAKALRKSLGLSFFGLLRALAEDPDIDLIAGVVWLARRVKGDPVTYEEIAAEMTYDAMEGVQVEQVHTAEAMPEDPADPEG